MVFLTLNGIAAAGFASVEATRYLLQAMQLSAAKCITFYPWASSLSLLHNTRCVCKSSGHMLPYAFHALQKILVHRLHGTAACLFNSFPLNNFQHQFLESHPLGQGAVC